MKMQILFYFLKKENVPVSESRVTGILGPEMALSGGNGSDFGLAEQVTFATSRWDWQVGEIEPQEEQSLEGERWAAAPAKLMRVRVRSKTELGVSQDCMGVSDVLRNWDFIYWSE